MELILTAPLSAALWYGVIKWVRYLDTRDLLDNLRPTAAGAAQVELEHPSAMVRR